MSSPSQEQLRPLIEKEQQTVSKSVSPTRYHMDSSQEDIDYSKVAKCFHTPTKSHSFMNRFTFYNKTTIKKACSLSELKLPQKTDQFDPLKDVPFWLDILQPTDEELFLIGNVFLY